MTNDNPTFDPDFPANLDVAREDLGYDPKTDRIHKGPVTQFDGTAAGFEDTGRATPKVQHERSSDPRQSGTDAPLSDDDRLRGETLKVLFSILTNAGDFKETGRLCHVIAFLIGAHRATTQAEWAKVNHVSDGYASQLLRSPPKEFAFLAVFNARQKAKPVKVPATGEGEDHPEEYVTTN